MPIPFFNRNNVDTTNRRIFRAALTIGLIGLLPKAAIAFRELMVARWFGRNDALDAFLIAYLLPSFVVNLMMGALALALIPVLVEIRQKQGTKSAEELVSNLVLLSVLALSGIAVLLALFAPLYLPYLGSNFTAAKLHLTSELLYTLLPWVVFNGISLFACSVLNAGEKFAFPALAPVITPLLTVLFVAFAAHSLGAFALSAGAVTGSIIEAGLLIRFLRAHGIHLRLRWTPGHQELGNVLRQCWPMLAGTFLMGSTTVVDQSMAAMLPPGSVAALSYANKIVSALLTTAATALSTAVLPYFARMVAVNDWQGVRHTLRRYSTLVCAAAVPFTLLFMVFSKSIVRLVLQRGAFTHADTELVSHVQICYALQIPFYVWGMLFVRFLSSVKRNDLLMYASAANLALDIVMNLTLIRFFGIAGIALSTSLVYLFSCTFVGVCSVKILSRQIRSAPAPVAVGGMP